MARWLTLLFVFVTTSAHALIGEKPFVSFTSVKGGAVVVEEGRGAAAIWMDAQDWPAVRRAATDVQADVKRVSGFLPDLATLHSPELGQAAKTVIIVGTLGKSRLIDELVENKKIDVKAIAGKWESFLVQVVERPVAGVERAVVIAGCDRRGTVYGLYDFSEQIGVSPWYWWADVPVQEHESLYVKPGRFVRGEPAVKYRGIFINDEAPAMQGWANGKFGGFNHELYGHVFELILRLRGNYLWPAMWQPHALIADDPESAPLAEKYGIVLGTSHHEPMMRAHDEWSRFNGGEWDYTKSEAKLREFWRTGVERVQGNEKIVTVGMRGDGDTAMSPDTNTALLERIVSDQRSILEQVTGRPAAETPQIWALYKEVQDYYEKGMRVPDDVTLLWCDDNWGNIRRLPLPNERQRAGGAGIYYHLEYVGRPRNYKWINTVPITKVWEQMNLAAKYDATRVWIVNVGDIKPLEFPAEFFLNMAWNPSRWSADRLNEFTVAWATREFGPKHAADIAKLMNGYTKLNYRRKPELLAPDTFSFVNYDEAGRVLAEWQALVDLAERVNADLPDSARSAFFQLVLYPLQASANVQELYIATGLNQLYARQGRVTANEQRARAIALFEKDRELVRTYHQLNGGKWNFMMSQAKLGYTSWQQPDIEVAPPLVEVHPRADAAMGVAVEGNETAFPSRLSGEARLPPLNAVARSARQIEVFNRGAMPFTFTAKASEPWLTVTPASGSVTTSTALKVSADWSRVANASSPSSGGVNASASPTAARIHIEASTGEKRDIEVPIENLTALPTRTFKGFIESDRHIAIEAPHFTRAINESTVAWRVLPDFGRTLGGVTTIPVTAEARQHKARLEYDVWLVSTGEMRVELQLAPSLDVQSGEGLRFALSFDDEAPEVLHLGSMKVMEDWDRAVSDGVRRLISIHKITTPGKHTLKLWRITPGVVFERIIIDAGGVRPSYLGPPESPSANQASLSFSMSAYAE